MILILDNIRSVENVGSIFRTADAFGVEKIYLCGLTPSPVDRFGRNRKDLHKTALGAENFVDWEYDENIENLVNKLKGSFEIISVEQNGKSVKYKDFKQQKEKPIVLIFGSETEGVNKNVLKISDKIIEIPMKGKKESLNVSVTVGIILSTFDT